MNAELSMYRPQHPVRIPSDMITEDQTNLLVDLITVGLLQVRPRSIEAEYKSMYHVMAYQVAAFLNSSLLTYLTNVTPFEVEQRILKCSSAHDEESIRRSIWDCLDYLEQQEETPVAS